MWKCCSLYGKIITLCLIIQSCCRQLPHQLEQYMTKSCARLVKKERDGLLYTPKPSRSSLLSQDKYRTIPGDFYSKHIEYYMGHVTTLSSSKCIEKNVVLVTICSITLRDYFNSSELLGQLKDIDFLPQAKHLFQPLSLPSIC